MAKRRDYIPSKVSDFVDFQNRLCDEVNTNAGAWGIDEAVVKALNEQRKSYLEAHGKAKDTFTRSQQDVLHHDETRAAYTQFLRTLVQVSLMRNTKIPMTVKVSAGWISDKAGRRKFKKIIDRPVCYPESTSSARVRFSCYTQNGSGRPKLHEECHAVEVEYMLLDVPQLPHDVSRAFVASGRNVSSKARFTIDVGRSGQWLFCRSRWINTSDDLLSGTWGEVKMVLVH